MPHSFADIPHEIRRRVTGGERVALLLLDALGLAFLHRHDDHPLVRRLQITPLRSQLPSTTTAHVTTMHFGVPVENHRLYEWNILEPALGAVICPLRFSPAGVADSEGSSAGSILPPWRWGRRSTRRSERPPSSCSPGRSSTRRSRAWRREARPCAAWSH